MTTPTQQVLRWQCGSKLGEGATGITFLGWDPSTQSEVTLKLLKPALSRSGTVQERFLAQALSPPKIEHPNISSVVALVRREDELWIVSGFQRGRRLDEFTMLPAMADRLKLARGFSDLLEALQFAHDRGFIHADIKPGNLLLSPEAPAKLLDVSLSRILGHTWEVRQLLGAPGYRSPESEALEELTTRTDIYSMGAGLYHLLTGVPPLGQVTFDSAIPKELRGVAERALERDPARRFATAHEFRMALLAACASAAPPAVASAPARVREPAAAGVPGARLPKALATSASGWPRVWSHAAKHAYIPIVLAGIAVAGWMLLREDDAARAMSASQTVTAVETPAPEVASPAPQTISGKILPAAVQEPKAVVPPPRPESRLVEPETRQPARVTRTAKPFVMPERRAAAGPRPSVITETPQLSLPATGPGGVSPIAIPAAPAPAPLAPQIPPPEAQREPVAQAPVPPVAETAAPAPVVTEVARLLSAPQPPYPPAARASRAAGKVALEAIVGADGRVQSVRVLKGHPLLSGAAAAAVKRWVYAPAKINGRPVASPAQVEVMFTLPGP
jgi:serine/threonine-protein kinase